MKKLFLLTILICSSRYTFAQTLVIHSVQKNEFKDVALSDTIVIQNELNNGDPVYDFVQKAPMFKGGQEALLQYLATSIKYPALARENGIEGKVVIRFIVQKDGSIAKAQIVRGIGGGCDQEALRVVRVMPLWTPGSHNGKDVNVSFTLPISFHLDGAPVKK